MEKILTLVQSKGIKGGIIMAFLCASPVSADQIVSSKSNSLTSHVIIVNKHGELLKPGDKPYEKINENEYEKYFEDNINTLIQRQGAKIRNW